MIMNLYILNDVLYDYTAGMCVIAAESMEQCKQLFLDEFSSDGGSEYAVARNKELQEDFDTASIKVIENVNHPAGVVAYEYGGG